MSRHITLRVPLVILGGALLGFLIWFFPSSSATSHLTPEEISSALEECENPEPQGATEKQACWANILEDMLETRGLDAAFDVFEELYKKNATTTKSCHWMGHVLGEKAYELYSGGEKEALIQERARYCGYGFFHGFIERTAQETGDFQKIFAFCQEVKQSSPPELPGLYLGCIHGVGHGAMSFVLETHVELWGDFQALLNLGVGLCENNVKGRAALEQCYSGVFSELQRSIKGSEYGFSWQTFIAKEDPFLYCHEQKEPYQEYCYRYFTTLYSSRLYPNDFQKALGALSGDLHLLPEAYAPVAVQKLSADFMRLDVAKPDQEEHVSLCRSLPANLQSSCIDGILVGFLAFAEPGQEHQKGIELCEADYLRPNEQEFCYEKLTQYFFHISLPALKEICLQVPSQYKKQIVNQVCSTVLP